uniref:RNA polymerase beta'' subunit n=1 Tax=Phaeostrophion irregulare TaxID=243268 RepID=UPI002E7773FE|nr:RNA polymerase beta'' subunit [Phaeostrophion irregulare]WAM64351.1 RNA polymerase beta'' subunit [Phaeostrophion irregulare]
MIKKSTIFFNSVINKKELKKIIEWAFKMHGQRKAAFLVDQLKEIGFEYATKSGISISIEDLKIPPAKTVLMNEANQEIFHTEIQVNSGEITEVERFQKIIYIWNSTSEYLKEELINFFEKTDPLNSVYIMAFSGARGNIAQVRQLVGMRGLMSDASGELIDRAIGSNFREGLSITDYIVSSYGARKGIVDTAIKTADSGYLTRRLVEVVQSTIISELDCKTKRGIALPNKNIEKIKLLSSLKERAIGRVLAFPVFTLEDNVLLANRNQQITSKLIDMFIDLNIKNIIIRSPLTCYSRRAVCQHCYGWNLASGKLVDLGETVGLIAAQSIGEPGTQLTMRTFHTGGIFTSELTRQARSGRIGYTNFAPEMITKPFRTNYGQDTLRTEKASSIRITNSANEDIHVPIPPETLIFIKNHTWIKPNDVLFEAAPSAREKKLAKKEIKYVVAKAPGEIVLEEYGSPKIVIAKNFTKRRRNKKSYSFWVLSGTVFNTPFLFDIKLRPFTKVYKNQSVAQSKITTTMSGCIKFCTNELTSETNSLKVLNSSVSLENFKLFIEKTSYEINNYKCYLSPTHDILIMPEKLNEKIFSIGTLNNRIYQTKTGGHFFVFDFHEPTRLTNYNNNRVQCGCTIFYIPETTILTKVNIKDFNFKKEDFVQEDLEIFPEYFIDISGYITFELEKQKIKRIIIKPGQRYFVDKNKINLEQISEQVYFPGEILFGQINIECLSYLEIGNSKKGTYIQLRPITRYEVTKEKSLYSLQQKCFVDDKLKIEEFDLNINSGSLIKIDAPIQFISSPIILDYSYNSKNIEIILEFKKPKKKNSWGKLKLSYSETFLFGALIPSEVKFQNINFSIIVEENQFVEAYSIIGIMSMKNTSNTFIRSIKTKTSRKYSNIILTAMSDHESIFLDEFTHKYKANQFLNATAAFGNSLHFSQAGLIRSASGNQILYQTGEPYLFSIGATIRKIPGDYVKSRDNLGELIFERLKTGDIIQGLPKIEEILEARNPNMKEAFLATRPGLVTSINHTSRALLISTKPNDEEVNPYSIERATTLLVKKFEFINVGDTLTIGAVNPHTLIYVYFRYFFALGTLSMYESAYRSTKKLQSLIFNSVQAIYISQGVIISNKHVELIVKEMTNKVSVDYPGETNFLPGDILDLEQANYINMSIKNQHKLVFRPILLGITKASLKTESFLAAASFQETTKVLLQAAMQGKTDWLRGLKENAITGRLIPAGTGFYTDLNFNRAMVPNSSVEKESNPSLQNQFKWKQNKLKNLLKFKYNK